MSTVQVWTCGRFIVAETAWLEDIGDGKTHLYNFCTGEAEKRTNINCLSSHFKDTLRSNKIDYSTWPTTRKYPSSYKISSSIRMDPSSTLPVALVPVDFRVSK